MDGDAFRLDLTRRPRRLRRTAAIRRLREETAVLPRHLIEPIFVIEGEDAEERVDSMPGVRRFTVDRAIEQGREAWNLGIGAVALFPRIDASLKHDDGREALNPDGLIPRAARAVKDALPELAVVTDIALDPYTAHGHDGLYDPAARRIANDATVEILCDMAVLHAEAGVDFVAPSDMMDGRVGAIREALDGQGFEDTAIMAYTAKYASAFYGPFREAVGSGGEGAPPLDKADYQLDPANRREALTELRLDEDEGADIVMVKPAGPYLDIIRELREATDLPVAAYQVSGEYAQLHAAAERGWLDLEGGRDESLLAIRRAGANMILTYFAREFARSAGERR